MKVIQQSYIDINSTTIVLSMFEIAIVSAPQFNSIFATKKKNSWSYHFISCVRNNWNVCLRTIDPSFCVIFSYVERGCRINQEIDLMQNACRIYAGIDGWVSVVFVNVFFFSSLLLARIFNCTWNIDQAMHATLVVIRSSIWWVRVRMLVYLFLDVSLLFFSIFVIWIYLFRMYILN